MDQCKYCFSKRSGRFETCLICNQYYRRDRTWRLKAVYLFDNGLGLLSIAARVGKSYRKDILPLLISSNRISRREAGKYCLECSDETEYTIHGSSVS